MGVYRARDVFLVPSLISLLRIPLAVAFPCVHKDPWLALGVLVASGVSDVLDGFWARRFDQCTATGAAIDPITDKIFVLTVVVTLVVAGDLSPWSVLLLSTRELGELPLVIWLSFDASARKRRREHPKANAAGKAATAMQFAAVVAALFHAQVTPILVWITAVFGVVAAVSYWRRYHLQPKPR